ncbi:Macrolide export ATP-binding/permease protein MacB [Aliiroseovarius pelagivivens]|uniref:Macrolide export ATP-binding/permease protein MacB n=1 Tax=Aliiroseovarius pelagivivens TaxID=1639690 RepID=A0A2R8AMK3_9RHOB|nr:ABC transporter permease [Aliiroseovarius pelagivivens]SPF77117.1 Macrolide export ATP-binding/permease protein MacB [Aliiroseovarius pelagivivens]
MIWETFKLALQSILRNPMRSFLTVLGVVIGVASVIAMVTVGNGSTAQVTADVESLGANLLTLQPGQDRMGPGNDGGGAARPFDMDDVDTILKQVNSISVAVPTGSRQAVAIYEGENYQTSITGTMNGYFDATDWPLSDGRLFSSAEEKGRSVCIIGETVREELMGQADPIGQKIRIESLNCTVVGLLEAKGANTFGMDQDDIVLMPFTTFARRIAGSDDVSSITLSVREGYSTDRAIDDLTDLMREVRRIDDGEEDDFSIRDTEQLANMLGSITSVLTGLLSAVAAVSLLVGGIGIMNIMLVSVTERTREIGIRMAVGAQASQVLLQFLVEAIVLSALGGLLGIALGLGMGAVGASMLNVPFAPQPGVIALAFGFSAVVGVVFGYFPARAAARLDPIEALRHG